MDPGKLVVGVCRGGVWRACLCCKGRCARQFVPMGIADCKSGGGKSAKRGLRRGLECVSTLQDVVGCSRARWVSHPAKCACRISTRMTCSSPNTHGTWINASVCSLSSLRARHCFVLQGFLKLSSCAYTPTVRPSEAENNETHRPGIEGQEPQGQARRLDRRHDGRQRWRPRPT